MIQKYKIPVTWEMMGDFEVEADCLEQALEIIEDSDALPKNASYVETSMLVNRQCLEAEYGKYGGEIYERPDLYGSLIKAEEKQGDIRPKFYRLIQTGPTPLYVISYAGVVLVEGKSSVELHRRHENISSISIEQEMVPRPMVAARSEVRLLLLHISDSDPFYNQTISYKIEPVDFMEYFISVEEYQKPSGKETPNE